MADIKKVIVVNEDGTTEEYERFVGCFTDDEKVRIATKDVALSEMAIIAHMINKEFDKQMEEITYREECEND